MLFTTLTTLFTFVLAVAAGDKKCFSDTKYTLSMFDFDSGKAQPLYAIDNGVGSILLVADPQLNVYESGVAPNTNINVELTDMASGPLAAQIGVFSLSVPDMGARYGSAAPLTADKGGAWAHWSTGPDMILPQQTSATQGFFSCDAEVINLKWKALSWGLMGSDGSLPKGCSGTIVSKVHNVEVPC